MGASLLAGVRSWLLSTLVTLLSALVMLTLLQCQVSDGKRNDPGPIVSRKEEVRVFEKAPLGFSVYDVQLPSLLDITQHRAVHVVVAGKDHQSFQLSSSNVLKVEKYPGLDQPVGHTYHVTVEVSTFDGQTLLAALQLDIIVSKRNKFSPVLDPESYSGLEVFRMVATGSVVAKVTSSDADQDSYNRIPTYQLLRSRGDVPLEIDPKEGTISTTGSLKDLPSEVQLRLKVSDAGSPSLSSSVNTTVAIRNTSEPQKVTMQVLNSTSARLCWYKPRYGRVRKYEITYALQQRPLEVDRKTVQRKSADKQCTRLYGLQPRMEHLLLIRALDRQDEGVAKKMTFFMDNSLCANKCGRRKCLLVPEDPGYQCFCDNGGENDDVPCDQGNCDVTNCGAADDDRCSCAEGDSVCLSRCLLSKLDCQHDGVAEIINGKALCLCVEGYYGASCEHYNPCTNIQCQHGATCRNISTTEYRCVCAEGYFGDVCERYNPCTSEPCLNGGYCRNVSDTGYVCSCNFGYFGQICHRYDPCSTGPCQNNGMCRNTSDTTYDCHCRPGYHGYDCEFYNPCLDEPCLFDGMCNSVDGEIFCDCSLARFGKICEHINLCTLLEPCGDHGVTCHNLSDSSYKCVCQPGWSGINCTQYDPCFGDPCLNAGTCHVTSEGYDCQCARMHHGTNCQLTNHCLSAPCKNGATCVNEPDHFQCECPEGYYGDKCEHLNPCVKNACVNGATCVNVSSTAYECQCVAGYFGDECQHFNSCYTNPCKKGDCTTQRNGKHKCHCYTGYYGPECQFYDPCASSPCLNGGHCETISDQEIECTCPVHYFGDRCQHFDACHSNPCIAGTCHNSPGADFYCACPLDRYGRTCESRDPCADVPCQNGGRCINIGRQHYTCECLRGYGGSHCEDYNPCSSLPCANGGTCDVTSDGQFTCRCQTEYQGPLCQDEVPCHHIERKICFNDGTCYQHPNGTFYCLCEHGFYGPRCGSFDPCSIKGTCYHGGRCVSLPHGLSECECRPGFFGQRCENFNPCRHSRCRHNATCVQTSQGDVCICAYGFTGQLCEVDIDDCWPPDLCQNGGTCLDMPGYYRCLCPVGFQGSNCETRVQCQVNVTYEASGTYEWPSIEINHHASMQCARTPGHFATRKCRLNEYGAAIWDLPDVSQCHVGMQKAAMAQEALSPFADRTDVYQTLRQVEAAVRVMEAALPFAYEDSKVALKIVDTTDRLLTLAEDLLSPNNITDRILAVVDNLVSNVMWTSNWTVQRENFEVQLMTIQQTQQHIVFQPNNGNSDSELTVPAELSKSLAGERLKMVFFNSSKLFVTPGTTWRDVGHVIAASVGMRRLDHLTHCIRLGMPARHGSRHSRCVYWKPKDHYWSPEGVVTLSFKNDRTTCCATHLTHFATVTDPVVSAVSLVREDIPVLLASHIGTGIAIICISIVLFTYAVFRSLNRENLGQSVIQLSISLLLQEVCVLVGFSRGQLGVHPLCVGVAILSHYFSLSSLLWAAVTAQHIYKVLSKEYTIQESLFLLKRCTLAWGVPLITVGVAIGLDIASYDNDPECCQMSVSNIYVYYSTYIVPILILLTVNAVMCAVVIRAAWRTDYHRRTTASVQTTQILGILGVLSVLALTWITGFLMSLSQTRRYATYVVYVCFTLHGILGLCLFLSFFALRPDARATWGMCCKGKGLSNRRRVAGKNSVATPTAKEANYRLVKDKMNSGPIPPEHERILKTEARSGRPPSTGGVGFDYSVDDASASRMRNHYRILPDNESYPNSPVRGLRRQNPEVQMPVRLGDDWVTNTRV